MADAVFAALDRVQALASRAGLGFQWPCWLLDWAWDKQATPYPAEREQLEATDGKA